MTVTSYKRIFEMIALSFLDVIIVLSFLDFQTPVKVSKITQTPIRIKMPEIGKKKLLTIANNCIEYDCNLDMSKSICVFIFRTVLPIGK